MNNDKILAKIDEIINYIEQTDNYQKYLLLKEKMINDKEINNLQDEIKSLNKMLANNLKPKKELETMIKVRNDLLIKNPLYREYLNCVDEINNTFNIIENMLNNYMKDKIN